MDLQPYSRSLENCLDGNHLYGTRQDWFNHELKLHRRLWDVY